MTARILLILEKARGHRPRLQRRFVELYKGLLGKGGLNVQPRCSL
jgi:hypothetical protein